MVQKTNTPNSIPGAKKTGSFGIPENMRPEVIRAKQEEMEDLKQKEEAAKKEEAEASESASAEQVSVNKILTPEEMLKNIGVEFTDDDFMHYLMKGCIYKNIDIFKGKMKVTLKTLTVGDYDMVNELVAKELAEVKMTTDGLEKRSAVIELCAALTEIQGKPFPDMRELKKKHTKKETFTDEEIVLARRDEVRKMGATLVDMLLNTRAVYEASIRSIVKGNSDKLKNS